MTNDYFKYYKSKQLLLLIVYFTTLFLWVKSNWGWALSITTALGFLFWAIDKFLWKYKPFKWLFWIDDFSGRYEGVLKYCYRDEDGVLQSGERRLIKTIHQTGSKICVTSFIIQPDGTKSSESINRGMHFEKTEDERHFRLIYVYLNDGNTSQRLSPHYGTEVIKFIRTKDTKMLSGRYFTEREPYQTKGEFSDLKWVSDDLNHEY